MPYLSIQDREAHFLLFGYTVVTIYSFPAIACWVSPKGRNEVDTIRRLIRCPF